MTARPATFYWPSFADMAEQPTARLHHADDGACAVIDLSGHDAVVLHLHTAAQCDALIRAAVAAKDLLLAAQAKAKRATPAEAAPVCASCGAAGDLVSARDTGGDGSILYYCTDTGACGRRRQAKAEAPLPGTIGQLMDRM